MANPTEQNVSLLSSTLGIVHPIIGAPMGGGFSTPELVAAVSNAGGLGSLGSAYDSPEKIRADIRAARALTTKPFAVNLFAAAPLTEAPVDLQPMLALLAAYHKELGIPPPEPPKAKGYGFGDQLQVVLEEKPPVFSFTMGIPAPDEIEALHERGIFIMGTATTVREAVHLETAGVDAIIAQGAEAGAHRGRFLDAPDSMVGLFALIPQIQAAARLPIVASGGIMDGRGIAAALMLGAQAVQLGTAFLLTHESPAHENYKKALLAAKPEETRITTAFSGREARGIVNRFLREVEESGVPIPAFPIQNELTRPMRRAATSRGLTDFMSLWGGQNSGAGRRISVQELVDRLVEELRECGASALH